MSKIIKLSLAILLLLCLLDMPYGFFMLVRFFALIGFGLLAYEARQENREVEMILFGALALLFQPIFKIELGRELWNVVDVIVAAGLLYLLWKNPFPKKV